MGSSSVRVARRAPRVPPATALAVPHPDRRPHRVAGTPRTLLDIGPAGEETLVIGDAHSLRGLGGTCTTPRPKCFANSSSGTCRPAWHGLWDGGTDGPSMAAAVTARTGTDGTASAYGTESSLA